MQIIYTRTFVFLPVSAEMTSGFQCEHGTGMDQACDAALRQIKDKEYDAGLLQEGYTQVYYYGIAFFKKQCRVKMCRKML